VQFPKTGGYWANRVKIMLGNKGDWITMPINRSYSGTRNINQIEIDNSRNWNEKMLKTISVNYKKAPYFGSVYPIAEKLLNSPGSDLSGFNLKVIKEFCNLLEIGIKHFITGSELDVNGTSTDLLVQIVKSVECDAYMCGGGASKYQEDEKFEENGIKLIYQNFKHPVYKQFNSGEFVPGLSVLDALMNCGPAKTAEMIKEQV
jgi:hypothetical protein